MPRRKRGWNVASRLSLEDLQSLIEAKQSDVADLQDRRDDLATELAEIDSQLAETGGGKRRGRKPGRPKGKRGPGRPKGSRNKAKAESGGTRGRKPGPKGQSDLHNLIRASFNGSGPMKAADIAKKVVAGGYRTKSKGFHLIVGQRLAEMKDVKKPSRGLYSLT